MSLIFMEVQLLIFRLIDQVSRTFDNYFLTFSFISSKLYFSAYQYYQLELLKNCNKINISSLIITKYYIVISLAIFDEVPDFLVVTSF